jgi:4-amino-4-deoxychorismate lyase
MQDLLSAEAMVIVNSVYGVLQVSHIDEQAVATNHWAKELRSQLHYVTH